jgi:hypothetical protein
MPMKITFATATLADDTASPRIAAVIEQWGGQSVVQTEPLYGGPNLAKFPRGNVGGQFVFTAGCSYATRDLAAAAFATAWSRLNTQGALALQPTGGSATVTMANAILRDVSRVEWAGVWLKLRYTFEITTVTSP